MPTSPPDRVPLAAMTLGPEVPAGDFAVRVHSVFPAALNLEVEGRRALVTLVGADAGDHPHAIRLATRERFDAWPLPPGTRGARAGGRLTFAAAPAGGAWSVDLAGAVRRRRREPPFVDPAGERARVHGAACAEQLVRRQRAHATELRLAAVQGREAPATAFGAHLVAGARALGRGLQCRDMDLAGAASARLLGLGGGLTPAGDDFLCGTLAALWCTSRPRSGTRCFARAWGRALSARLAATNAISATFITCAFAGSFSGAVTALAAAIAGTPAGGSGEEPRAALEDLCALGHSSGMDTATGFLFGLGLRIDEETRHHAPSI